MSFNHRADLLTAYCTDIGPHGRHWRMHKSILCNKGRCRRTNLYRSNNYEIRCHGTLLRTDRAIYKPHQPVCQRATYRQISRREPSLQVRITPSNPTPTNYRSVPFAYPPALEALETIFTPSGE